jgi:SOS-response transcriptional repressor LexA
MPRGARPPMAKTEMGARLKTAREKTGVRSARAAAIANGWTVSTYAAHENGQNEFDPATAETYAHAFGVSSGWLLTGENQEDLNLKSNKISVRHVNVRGVVSASRLIEPAFEQEIDTIVPFIPDRYANADQFAYRIEGNSMDLERIFDGDFVICVPYTVARTGPASGDVVVIEQHIGQAVRRTCKAIELRQGQVAFVPRSTDPRFQEAILTIRNGEMRDQDENFVEIVGLVIGSYRPR